ncbi:MAG TPA: DsrE family protein [Burkholderiales bacterium]|nr:DsrE family protein [Burkholderiales bacterium]
MRRIIPASVRATLLGLAVAASVTLASAAETEWVYPTIQGFGKTAALPHAAMQPSKSDEYKVVFNLTPGGDPDKFNAALDRVARTVNIFTSAGVPLSHLHFIVVIHGPATPIVMKNEAYRQKFNMDNPNIPLIAALTKANVKVVVCGQALAYNNIAHEAVNPEVEITLSAISDVIILEKAGYQLFPL